VCTLAFEPRVLSFLGKHTITQATTSAHFFFYQLFGERVFSVGQTGFQKWFSHLWPPTGGVTNFLPWVS
jgi:hypothetical protein